MSLITEVIMVDGAKVGRIIWDTIAGDVAFIPQITPSPFQNQNWASVDELRAAIVEAYRQEREGAA